MQTVSLCEGHKMTAGEGDGAAGGSGGGRGARGGSSVWADARRVGFQAPEDRRRWKAWLEGAITFKPRSRPPPERCYLYQPPANYSIPY